MADLQRVEVKNVVGIVNDTNASDVGAGAWKFTPTRF